MRSFFVTVAITAAALGTSARAEPPSFDCETAATLLDHLICSDGQLGRLDARLATAITARRTGMTDADGKALLQGQRDWLRDSLKRCDIPARNGVPEEPQSWRWAPCLAHLYRTRLRQLGQDEADPVMPTDAEFIHPLCLMVRPLDLAACTQGYRHVPVQRIDGGPWYGPGWSASGGDWTGGMSTEYHRIGAWSGGEALRVNDRFEDSGEEFTILVLKRSGGMVTVDYVLDRSSGMADGDSLDDAVIAAAVTDDGRIQVERRVTPYGLIRFANLPESEASLDGLTFTDAYYGTIRQEFSAKAQDGTVLSATLGMTDAAGGKAVIPTATPSRENTPRQACFDTLFADPRQPLPRTLDAAAYGDLAKAYVRKCVVKQGNRVKE